MHPHTITKQMQIYIVYPLDIEKLWNVYKKKKSTIYMLPEEINLYFLILKWKNETNSKMQFLGWQ